MKDWVLMELLVTNYHPNTGSQFIDSVYRICIGTGLIIQNVCVYVTLTVSVAGEMI